MENKTQSTKKKSLIIGLVVAIVILAIFVIPKKSETPVISDTATKEVDNTTDTKKATSTTSASLSRKEALEIYQDTIVRITDECFTSRSIHTRLLKKGDRIMIDNDTGRARTIIFGGVAYKISAHGYRTMALLSDGYVSSTCDPATGNISIGTVSSIESK